MPIVCPHCATSYAVDPSKFGPDGRSVRCARCKEVWLAHPDDAMQETVRALVPAMAVEQPPAPAREIAWQESPQDDIQNPPHIESPSIAGDMPVGPRLERATPQGEIIDAQVDETPVRATGNRRSRRPGRRLKDQTIPSKIGALFTLRIACVAFAALVAALMIWRADVVRLLPQTAIFYRAFGLDVNLRGLAFKDVKLSNETVDGKPVLVIEGNILGIAKKTVELPRLRFVVRDAKGVEIYGWNAVLEQAALNPGDTAWFRSRLAAPPPEGHTLDIRFFNKRDLAAGVA